MIEEVDGASFTWTYAYNSQGLLESSTDPLGNYTTLAYDKEGRTVDTTARDALGNTVSFIHPSYNPFGDMISRTFSEGGESYAYDSFGRLTQVDSGEAVLSYSGYDQANRPRDLSYDLSGNSYAQSLTYKKNGSLASVDGLPSGEVTYAYDSRGRLAQTYSGGDTFTYYYDPRGLPESLTLPGGAVKSYSYYDDGRPASVELTDSGATTTASVSLSYDARGRIEELIRNTGALDKATGTYTYAYDRMGRLESASSPDPLPDYSYSYDPRGPLYQKIVDPKDAGAVTTTYSYDISGRLTSDTQGNTYTYDAAGRMKKADGPRGLEQLAYDGLSRTISATTSQGEVSYAYDHTGRMVIRSGGGEEIFLPFAQTPEVAAIYAADDTNLYSYLCEPSGTHLSQTDNTTSTTTYPFRSPRSDVLALTDQTGALTNTYAYDPFGEMEEDYYSTDGTPFLYQDNYLDPATSLYNMQARWYDPTTSLFTSMDPQMGDASDPQTRLPYAYCAGDPVYNSDPTGKTYKDLLYAMRNPFLLMRIIKNPAFMLALLLKKSTRRGRSRGSANSGHNEEKSSSSGWPLIDVKPRSEEALHSEFIPNDISSSFGELELMFIRWHALTTKKTERLDPFLKLFGIKKGSGETLAEFLGDIVNNKETFMKRVQVNFMKLSPKEQMVTLSFYNPLTQELDLEKFGAVAEYSMLREEYDYRKNTEESWLGRTPILGDIFRYEMLPVKKLESWSTNRAITVSYGVTTLRKLWHGAQLMNYAVVEKDRWDTAAAEIKTYGDSPSIGGTLRNDPVYERYMQTVHTHNVNWASDVYRIFYRHI